MGTIEFETPAELLKEIPVQSLMLEVIYVSHSVPTPKKRTGGSITSHERRLRSPQTNRSAANNPLGIVQLYQPHESCQSKFTYRLSGTGWPHLRLFCQLMRQSGGGWHLIRFLETASQRAKSMTMELFIVIDERKLCVMDARCVLTVFPKSEHEVHGKVSPGSYFSRWPNNFNLSNRLGVA